MLNKRFTFLCSDDERQLLKSLSEHLHRSQGDTVRFLIRVAATELEQERATLADIRKNFVLGQNSDELHND